MQSYRVPDSYQHLLMIKLPDIFSFLGIPGNW